jgi:hypothetical protein
MKQILIACMAFGMLAACNSSKEVSSPAPEAQAQQPEATATPRTPQSSEVTPAPGAMRDAALDGAEAPKWGFTYDRQPCFGKCPWDSFTIYADGSVLYIGTRDVERIGSYKGRLPQTKATALQNKLSELGFFKWDDKYDNNITDLPSLQLRYMARDGFTKSVFIRGEEPTGTESLGNYMIGLYESVTEWEEVEDLEVPHNE